MLSQQKGKLSVTQEREGSKVLLRRNKSRCRKVVSENMVVTDHSAAARNVHVIHVADTRGRLALRNSGRRPVRSAPQPNSGALAKFTRSLTPVSPMAGVARSYKQETEAGHFEGRCEQPNMVLASGASPCALEAA